eukprot:scaffold8023_cov103-Isochrysis_galbana.AAC.8
MRGWELGRAAGKGQRGGRAAHSQPHVAGAARDTQCLRGGQGGGGRLDGERIAESLVQLYSCGERARARRIVSSAGGWGGYHRRDVRARGRVTHVHAQRRERERRDPSSRPRLGRRHPDQHLARAPSERQPDARGAAFGHGECRAGERRIEHHVGKVGQHNLHLQLPAAGRAAAGGQPAGRRVTAVDRLKHSTQVVCKAGLLRRDAVAVRCQVDDERPADQPRRAGAGAHTHRHVRDARGAVRKSKRVGGRRGGGSTRGGGSGQLQLDAQLGLGRHRDEQLVEHGPLRVAEAGLGDGDGVDATQEPDRYAFSGRHDGGAQHALPSRGGGGDDELGVRDGDGAAVGQHCRRPQHQREDWQPQLHQLVPVWPDWPQLGVQLGPQVDLGNLAVDHDARVHLEGAQPPQVGRAAVLEVDRQDADRNPRVVFTEESLHQLGLFTVPALVVRRGHLGAARVVAVLDHGANLARGGARVARLSEFLLEPLLLQPGLLHLVRRQPPVLLRARGGAPRLDHPAAAGRAAVHGCGRARADPANRHVRGTALLAQPFKAVACMAAAPCARVDAGSGARSRVAAACWRRRSRTFRCCTCRVAGLHVRWRQDAVGRPSRVKRCYRRDRARLPFLLMNGPVYLVHELRGREAGGAVSPPV